MRRSAPALAALSALAVTLSGCGGEDEAAQPAEEPAATSSSETSTLPPVTRPSQRQVDSRTAIAGLPGEEDLPEGWRQIEAPDPLTTTVSPEECRQLYNDSAEQDAFHEEHYKVVAYTYLQRRGPHGEEVLWVRILSHDERYPAEIMEQAGQALGPCQTHERTDNGRTLEVTASPLQVEPVGDQMVAMRLTAAQEQKDRLVVASGHNLLTVQVTGKRLEASSLLHDVAEGVLEKIDEG